MACSCSPATGLCDVTVKVVLADDEELLRTGFRMILESSEDIEVVGEAGNGHQVVELVLRLRPDVVLMDVRMPVMDGIAATREILRLMPAMPPRIIVLTTFDLDEYVHEALRAGAYGFLLKDLSAAGLAEAVRVVSRGDALLAPSVTRRLISSYRSRPSQAAVGKALDELTERELEVFGAIVQGLTNPEIAAALYLAEPTVKTYVGRLLTKLGCRDRVQLVIRGYELGIDATPP